MHMQVHTFKLVLPNGSTTTFEETGFSLEIAWSHIREAQAKGWLGEGRVILVSSTGC